MTPAYGARAPPARTTALVLPRPALSVVLRMPLRAGTRGTAATTTVVPIACMRSLRASELAPASRSERRVLDKPSTRRRTSPLAMVKSPAVMVGLLASVERRLADDVPAGLERVGVGTAGLAAEGGARADRGGADDVRLSGGRRLVAPGGIGERDFLAGVVPEVGPKRFLVGGLDAGDRQELLTGAARLAGVLERGDVVVGVLAVEHDARRVGVLVDRKSVV